MRRTCSSTSAMLARPGGPHALPRAGPEEGPRRGAVDGTRPRLEVEAVVERLVRVVGGAVVGEDVALEAPLALEDVLEQVLVLARVLAVEAVVRAHHRADVGLLDRGLELRQVDLAQRALVDLRVLVHAVALRGRRAERLAGRAGTGGRARALLVVGRVVLD